MKAKTNKVISAILLLTLCLTPILSYVTVNAATKSDKETVIDEPDGVSIEMEQNKLSVNVKNTAPESKDLYLYFYDNAETLSKDTSTWKDVLTKPCVDLNITGENDSENIELKTQDGKKVDLGKIEKKHNGIVKFNIPKDTIGSFELNISDIGYNYITIIPVMGTDNNLKSYEPIYKVYEDGVDNIPAEYIALEEKGAKFQVTRKIAENTIQNYEDVDVSNKEYDMVTFESKLNSPDTKATIYLNIYDENGKPADKNDVIIKTIYDRSTDGQYIKIDSDEQYQEINSKYNRFVIKAEKSDNLHYVTHFDFNADKNFYIEPVVEMDGSKKTYPKIEINSNEKNFEALWGEEAHDITADTYDVKEEKSNSAFYSAQTYGSGKPLYNSRDEFYNAYKSGTWKNLGYNETNITPSDINSGATKFSLSSKRYDMYYTNEGTRGSNGWCKDSGKWPPKYADRCETWVKVIGYYPDDTGSGYPYGWVKLEVEIDNSYSLPDAESWRYQRVGAYAWAPLPKPPKNPVNLHLEKKWHDNNNYYGTRPDSVIFDIDYSNDNGSTWEYLDYYYVTAEMGWKRDLDLTSDSRLNDKTRFRVTERPVSGYYAHNGDTGTRGLEVHNDMLTKLSVQKHWDDNNNGLKKRPDGINVTLQWKYSGEPDSTYKDFKTVELNESNGWYYEFNQSNCGNGLVREDKNGLYEWTIVEKDNPLGYEQSKASWSGNYKDGYVLNLTNTLQSGIGKLQKVSSNPDCTTNNDSYSLAGAKYGVYTKKSDAGNAKNEIATFITNEDGSSNSIELMAGTYYVKELEAPKGYRIDRTIYTMNVEPGKTVTITSTEPPIMDPLGVILSKHDADTGTNKPEGQGSLEGAEYTMKYFTEILSDPNTDPEKVGKQPVRTWVFRTDSDGYTYYVEEDDGFQYKVSGPDLFYGESGNPSIPAGTVTIQETKAPKGYHINPEVYVRQFKLENMGTGESINTSNMPKQPERSYQVNVVKKLEGTDIPIPNVEFGHIRPDGTEETLTTDENGRVDFRGLAEGTHEIYEKSKPFDVLLNTSRVTFKIENGVMTLLSNTSNDDNKITFEIKDNDGVMTVWDKPNTFIFDITKVNEDNKKLEGAEFTIYSDKDCKNVVSKQVTNKDGLLSFNNLELNHVYYLKETKAPDGYRLPQNEDGSDVVVTVEIRDNFVNHDGFGLYINGEYVDGDKPFGYGNVSIENDIIRTDIVVENLTQIKLPETGTHTGIIIMIIGFTCMGTAIIFYKKKSK